MRAVIFDCDGTLVDSESLGGRVMSECLLDLGVQLSAEEAVTRFRGAKLADCMVIIEQLFAVRLPENFVTDFRARLAHCFDNELQAMPGALEVLQALRLPCCVASSGPLAKMEQSLGLTGLRSFFGVHVYSSYEVGVWKPDPGLFLHAARQLGVSPEHCAVVEDSTLGVSAGQAAGMRVFALPPASDGELPANAVRLRTLHDLLAHLPAW